MSMRLLVLLALILLAPWPVLADEFGFESDKVHPHDFSADTTISDEQLLQYESALERVEESSTFKLPTVGEQLLRQADELLVSPLPPGVDELPFTLLEEDLDGDRDGLSDEEEGRLGTDPEQADTDGDGYIDGLEIVRGHNPLLASPDDSVSYQLTGADVGAADWVVTGVRMERLGQQELLTISGVAPALSLVALLVASDDPMMWVTRADATGRWRYSSEETLDVGAHTVYAAAVSVDGWVRAASSEYQFVMTSEGVIVASALPTVAALDEPEPEQGEVVLGFRMPILFASAALVVLLLTGGLSLVWYRNQKEKTNQPVP